MRGKRKTQGAKEGKGGGGGSHRGVVIKMHLLKQVK